MIKKTVGTLLTCIVVLWGLFTSCVYEYSENTLCDTIEGPNGYIVLNINTLDPKSLTPTNERIKSLRVLVVNTDVSGNSYVEINEVIGLEALAENFNYTFRKKTVAGSKDIYVFANEESVDKIKFTDKNLPSEVTDCEKLTDFFELYPPYNISTSDKGRAESADDEEVAEHNETVEQFKKALDAIYFEPDYEAMKSGDAIYLPYSVSYPSQRIQYEVSEAGGTGGGTIYSVIDPLYLVPVAIKFDFRFINYRTDDISLKGVKINTIDSQNYLMAHLAQNEIDKPFGTNDDGTPGPQYFWVQWLAKVTKELNDNPLTSNDIINKKYGWISNYTVPATSKKNEHSFLASETSLTIPAGDEDTPRTLVLPTCYLPESFNTTSYDGFTYEGQSFFLTLNLTDHLNLSPVFENVRLGNVGALFRCTHVVITVTLREGKVLAYAEIMGWNKLKAIGLAVFDQNQ